MLLNQKERRDRLLSSKLFAKKTKKMAEEPPTSIRGEATSPGNHMTLKIPGTRLETQIKKGVQSI